MKRFGIGVFVVIVLLCSMPALAGKHTLTPLDKKLPAPDFTLPDQQGKPVSLTDFRGRVLVVNFWASWCPACIEEMPSIQRGAEWLARFNGHFIAINIGETPQAVEPFLASRKLSIPILFDREGETAKRWGADRLPMTFVIDPEGRTVYRAMGARRWDDPMLLVPIRALGLTE